MGGTLGAALSYYYAVSALDSASNEGPLSFTVPAVTPSASTTNAVVITGLSFPVGTAAFNVYRGMTPQLLYRIASNVTPAATFTDNGLTPLPFGPPDPSFDHANFYFRYENAGPFQVSSATSNTITCDTLGATNLAYSGMVVRILEGTGSGQERSISTNTQTKLTLTTAWSVIPDTTSLFVIAENSWRFAAVSSTSPAQFEIPYRTGNAIQISGRGANVNNLEGDADLCPLTRWALGQGQADLAVPAAPDFQISVPGGGEIVLSEIGFQNLANVASISSGTLQLYAWNELEMQNTYTLLQAADGTSTNIALNAVPTGQIGTVIQIGTELMGIQVVDGSTNTYQVVRGILGSVASAHSAAASVLHLTTSTTIVPFAATFFENKASVNYMQTISVPDMSIRAAEFAATNALGTGVPNTYCYTTNAELGLRTLSGGQFALQVSGVLATQQTAAPPLSIEASHAVRDLFATVNQAPSGYSLNIYVLQNGNTYSSVTIASGNTTSNVIDGITLPPLIEGDVLTMNVVLNLVPGFSSNVVPGKDLTLTIRL
jgi:hypothetical protein